MNIPNIIEREVLLILKSKYTRQYDKATAIKEVWPTFITISQAIEWIREFK